MRVEVLRVLDLLFGAVREPGLPLRKSNQVTIVGKTLFLAMPIIL